MTENEIDEALASGVYLKRGREYEVVRFKRSGTPLVIKRARDSGPATERLVVEFERISLLVSISAAYRDAILSPIAAGFHRQHFYYVLPFVDGIALSEILREEKDENRVRSSVQSALDMAWKLQDAPLGVPKMGQDFLSFIKQFSMAEYSAARQRLPREWLDRPAIGIDGNRCTNLGRALDQLFESKRLRSLSQAYTLQSYRHWNLHGGNILFNRNFDICLIDPDTKILVHDPLFEIARLFYTARHDMVEHRSFTIESMDSSDFVLRYTLDDQQLRNYARLQTVDVREGLEAPAPADSPRGQVQWRLWLTFLSCLLRGINANYQEGENDSTEFRRTSNSLYLYLIATQFVNRLLEE